MTGVRLSDDWDDPGWVSVPRNIIRDERLSMKALGIVTYLASHKAGFLLTREFIYGSHRDGKDSIEAGLKELRDAGYLTVEQARDDRGQLAEGSDYVLHRVPVTRETRTTATTVVRENRTTGNPDSGKPATKRDHSLRETTGKVPVADAPELPLDLPEPEPSQDEEESPTVNQLAVKVAQRAYDRSRGLVNMGQVIKLAKTALNAGYEATRIDDAVRYLQQQNWKLTTDNLRQQLNGGPKPPSRNPTTSVPGQVRLASGHMLEGPAAY